MSARNQFSDRSQQRLGAPTHLALVVPSDGADLSDVSQMLYVESAGAVRVTTLGGEIITTPTLYPGWHPMEVTRIHASGTTATGLMVGR